MNGTGSAPTACLKYVTVDITQPIGTGKVAESKIIVHSVAAGGKWSGRGTMGHMSKMMGEEPEEAYKLIPGALGDAQMVVVTNRFNSGKLWVCNLYAQEHDGRGAPKLVWDAFLSGINKVAKMAIEHDASIHVSRLHPTIPGLDWQQVHDTFLELVVSKGVTVIIYTRDKSDASNYGSPAYPSATAPTLTPTLAPTPTPISAPAPAPAPAPIAHPPASTSSSKEKPFKGFHIAVTGYSPTENEELTKRIQEMGGTIQAKYKSFGAQKSTFLICDDRTEEWQHVDKLGGKCLTRAYVDECWLKGMLLPDGGFCFNPTKTKPSAHDLVQDSVSLPSKRQKKLELAMGNSTADSPLKRFDLQNLFSGLKFYVHDSRDSRSKNPAATSQNVNRYVVAFDGHAESTYISGTMDYIVLFGVYSKKDIPSFISLKDYGKIINVGWIWQCVNSMRKEPTDEFLLKY